MVLLVLNVKYIKLNSRVILLLKNKLHIFDDYFYYNNFTG